MISIGKFPFALAAIRLPTTFLPAALVTTNLEERHEPNSLTVIAKYPLVQPASRHGYGPEFRRRWKSVIRMRSEVVDKIPSADCNKPHRTRP